MTGRPRRPAGGYLLALDAGTGSGRAVLTDLAGRPAAVAQREWSHPPVPGVAGSQDFDWAGHWALICACIREVLGPLPRPAAVRAVGCSGMGGGLVLYDRRGRELWACANGDARAQRQAAALLASGTAAELYRLGGGWISLAAAPRLGWLREHEPARWAAAGRLSMIADWIVYRLTGTLVTEASAGSTSGLFDLARRAWSPAIMALCGLPPSLFPEVVEAGTVAGRVSPEAARLTGLPAGTPVVAGGLDTALALAGPGRGGPGQLSVTGGSFWKHTVAAGQAVTEPSGQLRTICHTRPGQWLVEGIGCYAGLALRWLRDGADGMGYAGLDRLAARVAPGADGRRARVIPIDAWTWARWRPPFPAGPPPGNAELARRARAVQEAAAYSARRSAGLLAGLLGTRFESAVLTGGAARSAGWPQILADVLGLPVHVPAVAESAASGAAALAGQAIGGPPPAPAMPGRVVHPDPARRDACQRLYEQWAAGPGAATH